MGTRLSTSPPSTRSCPPAGSSPPTTPADGAGQRWPQPMTPPRPAGGKRASGFGLTSPFHADGTVTSLDFGCVKRFPAERVSVPSALVAAALAGDAPAVMAAFI